MVTLATLRVQVGPLIAVVRIAVGSASPSERYPHRTVTVLIFRRAPTASAHRNIGPGIRTDVYKVKASESESRDGARDKVGRGQPPGFEPQAQVWFEARHCRFIEREVLGGEHVAPAAVGALEEEPVSAALEHEGQPLSPGLRLLFHRLEGCLPNDGWPARLVDVDAQERGDPPHLSFEVAFMSA